jgi:hypothetical protein
VPQSAAAGEVLGGTSAPGRRRHDVSAAGGRHRLHVDGDSVAAVTWWAAILAGFALLGVTVHDELDRTSGDLAAPVLTAPDIAPDDRPGGTA